MSLKTTFILDVDLKEPNYMGAVRVTSNDSIAFVINIKDDGAPFDLTDVTTISLVNTRQDKTTIVTQGSKTGSNQVTFNLGTNETAKPGRVTAIVQLYDTLGRVSTLAFTYTVIKDPTGEGYIPSKNEKTLIEIVLNDGPLVIQQAVEAIQLADEVSKRVPSRVVSGEHTLEEYQIPGEDVKMMTVVADSPDYTIFEIVAPRRPDGHKEATLTLMREIDPDSGGADFLDLYNMNYEDGEQMGIRIQTRGGTLKDFVFDFNAGGGTGIKQAMRIKPDKDIFYYGNQRYQSAEDQIHEFRNSSGVRQGYFGRIVSGARKMFRWLNSVVGSSFELQDDGNTVLYSPQGDFYIYLDVGQVLVNDDPVQTIGKTRLRSPDGKLWKAQITNAGAVTWVKQV